MGCSIPLPATAEANDSIRGECAMSCLFFYFLSGDSPLEKKTEEEEVVKKQKKKERVPRHFLRVKGVRKRERGRKDDLFRPLPRVVLFYRSFFRSCTIPERLRDHGRNSNADAIILHL